MATPHGSWKNSCQMPPPGRRRSSYSIPSRLRVATVPGSEAGLLDLARTASMSSLRDTARKHRLGAVPAEELHGTQRAAGSDFTSASAVSFGSTPATSFVVNSDSEIVAVAPAHVAATVQVSVVAPGGGANEVQLVPS